MRAALTALSTANALGDFLADFFGRGSGASLVRCFRFIIRAAPGFVPDDLSIAFNQTASEAAKELEGAFLPPTFRVVFFLLNVTIDNTFN